MKNSFLQKALPHLGAIAVMLLITAIYFLPQLQGKTIPQGDIVQHRAMSQEMNSIRDATGERPLWTNAMFGGMPTYQISTLSEGNLVVQLQRLGQLFISRPIGIFILLMLAFYTTLVLLGVNSWLSLIGALAFGLTTNNLVLYEAGHVTKLKTIAFYAPIVGGILLCFQKKYRLGALLFALGLSLNIAANHIQMSYYLFLNLLILGVIWLVHSIQNKELPVFAKSAGLLIVCAIVALGTTTSNLLPTLEYSHDTMRGKPILEKMASAETGSSSEVEGLDWGYAMRWSNGTIDLFSSFIPGVAGGGSGEKVSASSPLSKNPQWRQVLQQSGGKVPMYWGNLPFTSGPIYFGAVFFFLFIIGLFVLKGPLKWWFGSAVVFTFLLSLGENASWVNRTLFDYFPLFNKFRTPNSSLVVVSFIIPFMGVLALSTILQKKVSKQEALKAVYIAGGILGAICLFFATVGSSFFVMTGASDEQYAQYGLNIDVLMHARAALMQSDALRSLFFIALSGGLLWAFLTEKIKQPILLAGIALLSLIDVWQVGQRYLGHDDFIAQRQYKQQFNPRPVDAQILKTESSRGDYRVLDLSISTFNSASTSYFHNTVGGYNAAKLQRFQDVIDYHITKNNPTVLDMLNTKYIINREEQAQLNPNACGPAWFVDTISMAATANKEIEALNGLNPKRQVVVHQEFEDYLKGLQLNKNGSIELSIYRPDHLTYNTKTTSEQLAVFSEIWYGPDKGWNAYIDGAKVPHIRANYLLRALRIPAGEHLVEFKFEPRSFQLGRMISYCCSFLIFGALGFYIYTTVREEKE